jgi:hypothetical protein
MPGATEHGLDLLMSVDGGLQLSSEAQQTLTFMPTRPVPVESRESRRSSPLNLPSLHRPPLQFRQTIFFIDCASD